MNIAMVRVLFYIYCNAVILIAAAQFSRGPYFTLTENYFNAFTKYSTCLYTNLVTQRQSTSVVYLVIRFCQLIMIVVILNVML